jgi:hypothetical protein
VLEEDLASRGYVVIAIDHPYDASEVEFPSGRQVGSVPLQRLKKAEQDGAVPQLLAKVVAVRVADTRVVAGELPSLDAGRDPAPGARRCRQAWQARSTCTGSACSGCPVAGSRPRRPCTRTAAGNWTLR